MHQSRWMPFLAAIVLLVATAGKWYDLQTSYVGGDYIGLTPKFSVGLIIFEVGFAIVLLSDVLPPRWRWVQSACFVIFGIIALTKAMGGAASCGCFGRITVPPWYTAILDFALAVGLWVSKISSLNPLNCDRSKLLRIVISFNVAVIALIAGVSWSAMDSRVSSYDPSGLVRSGAVTLLQPDRWIVVMYQSDCVVCHDALPGYTTKSSSRTDNKVALVQMPPLQHVRKADRIGLVNGELTAKREWFATTPVVVMLDNGVVRDAAEGQAAVGLVPDWDRIRLTAKQ